MKKLFLAFGFAMLVCGSGTAVTDEQSSADQFNRCVNDPEMKNKSLNEQIDLIMKR